MKTNEHTSQFMQKIFLFALSFLFSGLIQPAFGQVPAPDFDLPVTLEMKTGNGKVRVILPADIRAGDTISGTVTLEAPANIVEGEVVQIKTVEGEVVATKKIDSSNNEPLTFTVPQGARGLILSCAGKHIKDGIIKVTPSANFSGSIPTQPGSFALPRLGQVGRPLTIPGNFDGNAANTTVNVGGREMPVVAESPRSAVVKIPPDTTTGSNNLTVRDGAGNSQTNKFNVVSLELTADKLNLLRGETTNVHVTVTGLQGLKDDSGNIKLSVENMSPQVVSLTFSPQFKQDGNGSAGTLLSRAVDLDGDNTIAFTEKLTGVNPGNFMINATMIVGLRGLIHEVIQKYWENQLNAIAALKEAAAAEAEKVKGNTKVPKELRENAAKLRNLAKRKLWDAKGEKLLLDLQKSLQQEKDELKRIQNAAGPASDTGKEIQKIKDALDKMAKDMGVTLDK